jgi:hypothetical protein
MAGERDTNLSRLASPLLLLLALAFYSTLYLLALGGVNKQTPTFNASSFELRLHVHVRVHPILSRSWDSGERKMNF